MTEEEKVENTPMSAETNLPTDQTPEVQATQVAQDGSLVEEPLTLDLEAEPLEPFDLSPEAVTPEAESSATPAVPSESQTQIQELTQRLEALQSQLKEKSTQLDDRNNLYMRIAADFENFRKRTEREKEEMEQKIKCSTLSELLPVVDNFERARSQIKPQSDAEMNIHKSYQGLYKDLVDRLKRIGVSPMRAEGQEFDPNLHEAVMRQPSHDQPEGTVLEELQRGYMMGDRVLRHALVKVASAPEDAEATAASESVSE